MEVMGGKIAEAGRSVEDLRRLAVWVVFDGIVRMLIWRLQPSEDTFKFNLSCFAV